MDFIRKWSSHRDNYLPTVVMIIQGQQGGMQCMFSNNYFAYNIFLQLFVDFETKLNKLIGTLEAEIPGGQ